MLQDSKAKKSSFGPDHPRVKAQMDLLDQIKGMADSELSNKHKEKLIGGLPGKMADASIVEFDVGLGKKPSSKSLDDEHGSDPKVESAEDEGEETSPGGDSIQPKALEGEDADDYEDCSEEELQSKIDKLTEKKAKLASKKA